MGCKTRVVVYKIHGKHNVEKNVNWNKKFTGKFNEELRVKPLWPLKKSQRKPNNELNGIVKKEKKQM